MHSFRKVCISVKMDVICATRGRIGKKKAKKIKIKFTGSRKFFREKKDRKFWADNAARTVSCWRCWLANPPPGMYGKS